MVVSSLAGLESQSTLDQYAVLEDLLLAHMLQNFEENRLKFSLLQPEFFRNENAVLYAMLSPIASESGVSVDEVYLKIYLQSHRYKFLGMGDRIELEAFKTEGQADPLVGLMTATVDKYRSLVVSPLVSELSFDDSLARFRTTYMGLAFEDALSEAQLALSSPVFYRGRSYVGVDGAMTLLDRQLSGVRSLVDDGYQYTLKSASEVDFEEEMQNRPQRLGDLTTMPTLNDAMRGIRTNRLVTMVAPEKGMKSKLATRVAHTVMLQGHNVCFWGKEGGSTKVKAELRAIHFDHYYNVERQKGYAKLSADDIITGELPPELVEAERVSWNDLFKSGQYGELFLPDYPFVYENLDTVVRQSAELHDCKLVVIDYVQIMGSERIPEVRRIIEEAYKRLESLKGMLNICIWCPAQMSADAIKAYKEGKLADVRNITLHSNEPTRSSDVNFLLYTNDDLDSKNIAELVGLPSRVYGRFDKFMVSTDKVANKVIEVRGQQVSLSESGDMVVSDVV